MSIVDSKDLLRDVRTYTGFNVSVALIDLKMKKRDKLREQKHYSA